MLSALDKARAAAAAKRAAGEASAPLTVVARAALKPTNRKLAIAAMCSRCLGGDETTTPIAAIRDCTAPTCPLYAVRPYQRRDGGAT